MKKAEDCEFELEFLPSRSSEFAGSTYIRIVKKIGGQKYALGKDAQGLDCVLELLDSDDK